MPFLDELEADLAQHGTSRGKLSSVLERLGGEAEDFLIALDEKDNVGRYRFGAERIVKILKSHHDILVAPTSIRNWRRERAS